MIGQNISASFGYQAACFLGLFAFVLPAACPHDDHAGIRIGLLHAEGKGIDTAVDFRVFHSGHIADNIALGVHAG